MVSTSEFGCMLGLLETHSDPVLNALVKIRHGQKVGYENPKHWLGPDEPRDEVGPDFCSLLYAKCTRWLQVGKKNKLPFETGNSQTREHEAPPCRPHVIGLRFAGGFASDGPCQSPIRV